MDTYCYGLSPTTITWSLENLRGLALEPLVALIKQKEISLFSYMNWLYKKKFFFIKIWNCIKYKNMQSWSQSSHPEKVKELI